MQRPVDEHYRYAATVIADLIRDGVERDHFRDLDPELVAEVLAGLGVSNARANEQVFELTVHGRVSRLIHTFHAAEDLTPPGAGANMPSTSVPMVQDQSCPGPALRQLWQWS